MKTTMALILTVATIMAFGSCGTNGSGGDDAATDPGQDMPGQDIPSADADIPAQDHGKDPGSVDDGGAKDLTGDLQPEMYSDDGPIQDVGKDTEIVNFGFEVRVPQEHTIPCNEPPMGPSELVAWDQDWICTFEYGGTTGHVYVQSTPVDCIVTMSAIPGYQSPGAWIAVDGAVEAMAKPYYDWGGNHHNDSMEFDHAGMHFKFYHSSIGFGWRKCQDMDCIQVYDSTGTTLQEDGCTKDRTLPVTCVLVKHDGTVPEFVDVSQLPSEQWPCPGDPNYR